VVSEAVKPSHVPRIKSVVETATDFSTHPLRETVRVNTAWAFDSGERQGKRGGAHLHTGAGRGGDVADVRRRRVDVRPAHHTEFICRQRSPSTLTQSSLHQSRFASGLSERLAVRTGTIRMGPFDLSVSHSGGGTELETDSGLKRVPLARTGDGLQNGLNERLS